MFQVTKRMEVAGAHSLSLPYESKCSNTHGHNWIIEVTVGALALNKSGMVIDFTHIKKIVNQLDHANLNQIIPNNPTAENIAAWIFASLTDLLMDTPVDPDERKHLNRKVVKVTVQESEGNSACYIP